MTRGRGRSVFSSQLVLALIALALLAVAFLAGGCGDSSPQAVDRPVDSRHLPSVSQSLTTTLEPQFGETTRPRPGEVILSTQARAFVPPPTLPLYRIVPTPITEAGVLGLADKLGMATDRKYSLHRSAGMSASVADDRWLLTFYRDDLDCFRLFAPEGERRATEGFERGESIQAVSEKEAIAVADEYLAALDYRQELGAPQVFARTSIGRSAGGSSVATDVEMVVITRGVSYPATVGGLRLIGAGVVVDVAPHGDVIGFSHTVQRAERDDVEITILSVEEAAKDIQDGEGLLPDEVPVSNGSRILIEGVELAHYSPPVALQETHYRPIYVFRVRVDDGGQGTWIVSAYEGIQR